MLSLMRWQIWRELAQHKTRTLLAALIYGALALVLAIPLAAMAA
jgi:hypothetical protein